MKTIASRRVGVLPALRVGRAALPRGPRFGGAAVVRSLCIFYSALAMLLGSARAPAQNWTLTSAPSNNWSAIAGSVDLEVLVATVKGGGIYCSTNSGTNWNLSNAPSNAWSSVASSTNGLRAVAAAVGGGIWISTNFGSSWSLSSVPASLSWASTASSADGGTLLALAPSDGIWISTNSGAEWTLTGAPTNLLPEGYWSFVLTSANGDRLFAVEYGPPGTIYFSTNSGIDWMTTGAPAGGLDFQFKSAACSADGTVITVDSCCEGTIYVSTNAGMTWIIGLDTGYWGPIESSSDGSKLVALEGSSPIYISADFGKEWSPLDAPVVDWLGIALSADGNRAVAIANGGGIYTWQPTVPVIASQPQDGIVLGGLGGSLDAGVFSTVPPTYQWQLDGTNLIGAVSSSLILNNISPSNSGTYTVIVSNSYGTTISRNAILKVVPAFVSTLSADYGISDAILGGSVTTGSNNTFVWFNWGMDTNYGNSTPANPVPDGVASLNFSNRITGLTPYTTYHYQVAASNAVGVVYGSDATVTTAPRFVWTTGTNGNWDAVAWSTNGGRMFATSSNTLYLSTNCGAGWTAISQAGFTVFIPSADGTDLAGLSGGAFYLTTNWGATWSSNSTPAIFSTFAASADLTKLVATGGSQIYVSTNTGASWSVTGAPDENWSVLASSADGTDLLAMYILGESPEQEGAAGVVYRSTNSGASWTKFVSVGDEFYVASLACSADGATVVITAEISVLTTNSGASWNGIPNGIFGPVGPDGTISAACSANGRTLAVTSVGFLGAGKPGLYISPDSGVDWFLANVPGAPVSVLVTADGTKFAAQNYGNIYISEPDPSPALTVGVMGNNLLLSWIVPTTNFTLQQSTDLVSWSAVTNAPSLNITNLQDQLLLPISQTQSFYRLKTL